MLRRKDDHETGRRSSRRYPGKEIAMRLATFKSVLAGAIAMAGLLGLGEVSAARAQLPAAGKLLVVTVYNPQNPPMAIAGAGGGYLGAHVFKAGESTGWAVQNGAWGG